MDSPLEEENRQLRYLSISWSSRPAPKSLIIRSVLITLGNWIQTFLSVPLTILASTALVVNSLIVELILQFKSPHLNSHHYMQL